MLPPVRAVASEGVVLLHGLWRGPKSLSGLEKALTKAGYVVVNHGYPSTKKTVEELADSEIPAVLSDPRLRDCTRIHFVTHSMGGILVRAYFKNVTSDRLGRVVMVGPPNRGSEVVDRIGHWGLFRVFSGPAGEELGTKSKLLKEDLGPVDFDLGVIAGDRSFNWINSLFFIHGVDDGKVSVENTKVTGMRDHITLHTSHPLMMGNKSVRRQIITFLHSGSFDR
jgi:hypothetical protein